VRTVSEPAAVVLIVLGLAFSWLLFRAFFRWLDVREHARLWGPKAPTTHPEDEPETGSRPRSA
jgi:hypothetical protein